MIIGAQSIIYSTNPEAGHAFLRDDVETLVGELQDRGLACTPAQNLGWGLLTSITLAGGGELGIYQPMHARPDPLIV